MYLRTSALALILPTVVLSVCLADGNPYTLTATTTPFANKGYAKKLEATIEYFNSQNDADNAGRTRTVQKTATFSWLSYSRDVPAIPALLEDAYQEQQASSKQQIVQLVIYNLPDRDCSAKASDGEFHLEDDGLNKYKRFIDDIASNITTRTAQQLSFVIILEPDALANVVTSTGEFPKCANAAPAYKEGIQYAINKLWRLPKVSLYLDAGHGGWLGDAETLEPAAQVFAEVLKGVPAARIRGLAINVSNYNPYIAKEREDYTGGSPSWDESHYIASLTPYLEREGFPTNFIVDQGRAGKQGIRPSWEWWCNLKNAGFGTRPTSSQDVLKNSNVDAIVWVKPGGESDGTSDQNSKRFDENCRGVVAHVPAPEAGEWFNEYVTNLVKNADPLLEVS